MGDVIGLDGKEVAAKVVDWEAMEPLWRAGIVSKLELSNRFGVSRAAIDKHFEKLGIARDLTAKIRAKADDLVTQDAVTPVVTGVTKAAEKDLILANAQMQAGVIRAHRAMIQRHRTLGDKLLSEVEGMTLGAALIEEVEAIAKNEDALSADAAAVLRKIMSIPGRVDAYRKLAQSLQVVVGLEREVFALDAAPASPASEAGPSATEVELANLERRLDELAAAAARQSA